MTREEAAEQLREWRKWIENSIRAEEEMYRIFATEPRLPDWVRSEAADRAGRALKVADSAFQELVNDLSSEPSITTQEGE